MKTRRRPHFRIDRLTNKDRQYHFCPLDFIAYTFFLSHSNSDSNRLFTKLIFPCLFNFSAFFSYFLEVHSRTDQSDRTGTTMAFRLSTGAACRQSFNILSFSCNANRTKRPFGASQREVAHESGRETFTSEGGQWRHSQISSIPNDFSHLLFLSRSSTIAVLKQSKQETFGEISVTDTRTWAESFQCNRTEQDLLCVRVFVLVDSKELKKQTNLPFQGL